MAANNNLLSGVKISLKKDTIPQGPLAKKLTLTSVPSFNLDKDVFSTAMGEAKNRETFLQDQLRVTEGVPTSRGASIQAIFRQ